MAIDLSTIDERSALLLRQGVALLQSDLNKRKGDLVKLTKLHYSTRAIEDDIELCSELDRVLDSQGDAIAESAIRSRETPDESKRLLSRNTPS